MREELETELMTNSRFVSTLDCCGQCYSKVLRIFFLFVEVSNLVFEFFGYVLKISSFLVACFCHPLWCVLINNKSCGL